MSRVNESVFRYLGRCALFLILFFSPLSLQADISLQYIASWGGDGDNEIRLNRPQALSITPSGRIYIADTGNHQILMLDARGKVLSRVGGLGWGKDQFDSPVAVDASNGLDVFVADYNNRRVLRYDKDLHFIASLQRQETWPEDFDLGFPVDVAISPQGELYCIDGENNRVLKFDMEGNPLFILGDFDAGEGRLIEPSSLLMRPDRSLWVPDKGTGSVAVFDEYGNFSHHWFGHSGMVPGLFANCDAWGIAILTQNPFQMVFMDQSEATLQRLDLAEIPMPSLKNPVSMAYYKSRLYILDQASGQIHVLTVQRTR